MALIQIPRNVLDAEEDAEFDTETMRLRMYNEGGYNFVDCPLPVLLEFVGQHVDVRQMIQGVADAKAGPVRDQPRELSEVINHMLIEIPETETSLIAGLESIRRRSWFAAPEAMGLWWRIAQKLLVREVGEPHEDWQRKVSEIFRGKP